MAPRTRKCIICSVLEIYFDGNRSANLVVSRYPEGKIYYGWYLLDPRSRRRSRDIAGSVNGFRDYGPPRSAHNRVGMRGTRPERTGSCRMGQTALSGVKDNREPCRCGDNGDHAAEMIGRNPHYLSPSDVPYLCAC